MKKISLFLLSLVLFIAQVSAQIIYKKKMPVGYQANLPMPEEFALPNFQSKVAEAEWKEDAEQFALPHPVQLNLTNSGTWQTLPDGTKIWRLLVTSAGAKNLNVEFNDFYLPKGAEFYAYAPDYNDFRGAYTHKNNREDGKFALFLLKGDRMILEYVQPTSVNGEPRVSIERFHHGYKGVLDFGTSGTCNNNVNCPEGAPWSNEIRASAMILNGGVNGIRWCSGSLVNNTRQDGTPYFLTANHCLSGSTANWAFMFNYQSPNCTNIDGPLTDAILGGTLVANDGPSDFALIELDNAPPASFNVYHAGWNANNVAGDSAVGIHHPDGDIKKISFDLDPYVSSSYGSGTNTHWRIVDWDDGTTEPGSSGSPLFDQRHHIVGQLHGGGAACGNNLDDYYGKFAYSWNAGTTPSTRLQDWLDPDNTGTTILDGADFNTPPTTLDAAMIDVSGIAASYCDTNITNVGMIFRNMGADTITSATITVSLDGSIFQTINWTGSLFYTQSFTQSINDFSVTQGTHTIQVVVSNPNFSVKDSNELNDTIVEVFTALNGNAFKAQVISDIFGNEISYRLLDEDNIQISSQLGFGDNTTTNVRVCIEEGCYQFILEDSGNNGNGDGIFNGGASLSVNGVSFEFIDGSEFTSADTIPFCVCEDGSVVSGKGISCNSDTSSVVSLITSEITIFPNPTKGSFTISTDRFVTGMKMQIHNFLGELVDERNITKRITEVNEELGSGMYTVRLIHQDQTTVVKKLIVN